MTKRKDIKVSNGSTLPAVINGPTGLREFNEFIAEADHLVGLYGWLCAIEKALKKGASTSLPPIENVEDARPDEKRLQELRARLRRFDGGEDDPRYENGYLEATYVSERLAALIGAFPNANPGSPTVFAHTMLQHVLAHEPCPLSLETTCRKIIEEKTFMPVVREVVVMLDGERELWRKRTWAICGTKNLYEEVLGALRKRRKAGRQKIETMQPRRITATPLVPLDPVREDQLEGVPT